MYKYYLVGLLFILLGSLQAQPDHLKFDRISVSDGLSHVTVNTTFQDSFGLLWIGTTDGLNVYDGYNFTIYKEDDLNPYSLQNNNILSIGEDESKNLWIGTYAGLFQYERATGNFHKIEGIGSANVTSFAPRDSSSFWVGTGKGLYAVNYNGTTKKINEAPESILALCKDRDKLWIGTASSGILIFENENFRTIEFRQDAQIRTISKAKDGYLWIGTDKHGIYTFKDDISEISQLLPDTEILSLTIDKNNNAWIGTNDDGLFKMDASGNALNYVFDKNDVQSISGNIIRSIYEDLSGKIWIGSWGNGLNMYDPDKSEFIHYRNHTQSPTTLGHNFIHAIWETHDNQIWVGTKDGLNILNPKTQNVQRIFADANNQLTNDYIKCIFQDKFDRLWVGTSHGLNIAKTYSNSPIFSRIDLGVNTENNDITFVKEDSRKRLWVGTWGGLFEIDSESLMATKKFDEYQSLCMVESTQGHFWIGTYYNGLLKFDPNTGSVERIRYESGNSKSLPNNRVWTMHRDTKGDIWVGTFGGGLAKLHEEGDSIWFDVWKERDGLSSNAIIGILEDEDQNLWISGNNGISKFDPKSNLFTNYYESDGLQGNHFNVAYHRSKQGTLYFGGSEGLTAFNPVHVKAFKKLTPIINDFELFNKPTEIGASAVLKSNLLLTDQITLNHEQNIFSFGFSDLHFGPNKSKFAYRLKNFNNEWTITDARRRYVTYTNIPAGTYTFELKTINRSGILNQSTATKSIVILPPWWKTWWFQILSTLSFFALIFGFFRMRVNRIEAQKRVLAKSVQERTQELELSKQQVEQDKLIIEKSLLERESLLKEIHHRVKNNLQIIASLLYLQSGKFNDEDFKKVLEEGQGRVRSMALIHQKLYENDDLKSIPFEEYLIELVSEIRVSFGMRDICLDIRAENVYFDVDTAVPLGLIVNELATNAFKYAFDVESKGCFSIYLTKEKDHFLLNIKDNGKGLPTEIDIRKTKSLGLRLVRMLSQQLEGDFEFKSDSGTIFKLKFAA